MPWELGYFDGHHTQSRVAICPIQDGTDTYAGEEYLGVYNPVEKIRQLGTLRPLSGSLLPGGRVDRAFRERSRGVSRSRGVDRDHTEAFVVERPCQGQDPP